jgi:hypothetical protein
MTYDCPVCAYPNLQYPARDYHICPCCGTEFGNDDAQFSHHQLREMWIIGGVVWFFGRPPANWNPWMQLILGGHARAIPFMYSIRNEETALVTETSVIGRNNNLVFATV